MAYKAYDLAEADIAAAFADLCTALVNMSWVLHDNVSATDKVYKSNGSNSDKPYGYMRIYTSSTSMYFEPYLYWDSGAHTGSVKAYCSSNHITFSPGSSRLAIAGDKDLFIVRNSYGVVPGKIFGHIPTFFRTTATTLTAGATAGDGATLTVASSSNMGAGSKFQIIGLTEGRDLLSVDSVTDATHIVVTNLPRNYASGAFLGQPAQCFGGNTYSAYEDRFMVVAFPDDVGQAAGSTDGAYINPLMAASYSDPDEQFGKYGLVPLMVRTSTSLLGLINGNILAAPLGAVDDLFSINDDASEAESGSRTSSTSTTISDSSKSWSVNALVDKYVSIVDGTGVKQVRKILSNTATQLTVNTWFIDPDVTSDFKISDKVYRLWNTNPLFAALESEYTI